MKDDETARWHPKAQVRPKAWVKQISGKWACGGKGVFYLSRSTVGTVADPRSRQFKI